MPPPPPVAAGRRGGGRAGRGLTLRRGDHEPGPRGLPSHRLQCRTRRKARCGRHLLCCSLPHRNSGGPCCSASRLTDCSTQGQGQAGHQGVGPSEQKAGCGMQGCQHTRAPASGSTQPAPGLQQAAEAAGRASGRRRAGVPLSGGASRGVQPAASAGGTCKSRAGGCTTHMEPPHHQRRHPRPRPATALGPAAGVGS